MENKQLIASILHTPIFNLEKESQQKFSIKYCQNSSGTRGRQIKWGICENDAEV